MRTEVIPRRCKSEVLTHFQNEISLLAQLLKRTKAVWRGILAQLPTVAEADPAVTGL
ncbi:MAG: hypothetical protein ACI9R3_006274 [Verrucomicrobiales bacterium]